MVDENKTRPIVVKRVKKAEHGHHGGSWKIAFADFMTAMFAIFLVLWLLLALDDDQRRGIGQYFQDPTAFKDPASREVIDFEGERQAPIDLEGMPIGRDWLETEEMRELAEDFHERVMGIPELEDYHDQILMDLTEDGLRIQLVDEEGRPMYESGSAQPEPHTQRILRALAEAFEGIPNPISISGHTDARPFVRDDYDNWFLSADRANEARVILRDAGLGSDRVAQVSGYADTIPFDREDPRSPVNRRISLTLLSPDAISRIAEREGSVGESLDMGQLEEGGPVDLLTPEERRERDEGAQLRREQPSEVEDPEPEQEAEDPEPEREAEEPEGEPDGEDAEGEPRDLLTPEERRRPEPETW
ncbi:flagellar motor protein MotB [Halorhodospira halochloris]|uniref:flagellar motor protein MotB n=1 Tax=Halorhodospira halochloris TaxID=1052 RepID=UPI002379292C|nr:flagellar motor protein MotB [Halorhodospira halochloris]